MVFFFKIKKKKFHFPIRRPIDAQTVTDRQSSCSKFVMDDDEETIFSIISLHIYY